MSSERGARSEERGTSKEVPSLDSGGSLVEPGIRYYLFLSAAGLIVLWLLLTETFGIFALVPVLLGALGLAVYLVPPSWGRLSRTFRRPLYMMPVLAIGSIVVFELLFGNPPWGYGSGSFELNDLLICPALLAYLAGQYRLFSLGTAVVPPDTRPRPDRLTGDEPEPRSARLVNPRELSWLGGILLACVLAGQLLWLGMITEWVIVDVDEPRRLDVGRVPWRMSLLIWLLGVGALVLVGFFRILRDYRMSGDEARMVMQEALWSETRGEQRRSARWLAWMRRRVRRQRERQA